MFKKISLVALVICLTVLMLYSEKRDENIVPVALSLIGVGISFGFFLYFEYKDEKRLKQDVIKALQEKEDLVAENMAKTLHVPEEEIQLAVEKIQKFGAKYSPEATKKVIVEMLSQGSEEEMKRYFKCKLNFFYNEIQNIKEIIQKSN